MIESTLVSLGYNRDVSRVRTFKNDVNDYRRLFSKDSIENRRFYNIGAGDFKHPCWTNIDFDSEWYNHHSNHNSKDILKYDLTSLEPIPVADNSAELVYSSHTVEHIPNDAAQNMFNEAYRMLKPGGLIRITTPDIKLVYRAYKDDDRDYLYWIPWYSKAYEMKRSKINTRMDEASTAQLFLSLFASSASIIHSDGADERITDEVLHKTFTDMKLDDALNYCLSKCSRETQRKYPGNHINWWHAEKMTEMFKEAGFEKIYRSGYGQSFAPVLRNQKLFDTTHPKISLYMEAIK